ncbi:unnamed protein product [Rotaria sordida]|uniref:Uncharacterized protein n=1 Tax=Rotaria sordida TaxID=392033 RepID=A0A815RGN3_9BILA|nr:unnamed protein product [Rotaria sordida]CAF1537317.1 unnamed protein product [Rotaria sordida]CAF4124344.1 unnamed protein product [Rotaria sordida]CAF4190223.1 unnamed protein product [Rotaria sordida]
MLETRVLCKILPRAFDNLEHFVDLNIYSSTINDSNSIYLKNQHHNVIQETKRRYLNISLDVYKLKIQEHQKQYQYELAQLMNSTTKMTNFQKKLLRQRQRSSVAKNAIGVSPEPYLDLISNPFNRFEWDHLSLGPSCIRSNQSAVRPRKQQETELSNEHKAISSKVQNHLVEHHHIPRTLPILKEYSNHLHQYLNQCYFAPLSYKDRIQALKQIQTLTSIRRKIKQHKLIIRLSDKGNNFYIGSATEFAHKVQKCFSDTNAFVELSYNPFNEILDNVIRLLNQLASKKLILQWQYKQMMSD